MKSGTRPSLFFALALFLIAWSAPAPAEDKKLDAILLVSPTTTVAIPVVNGQGSAQVFFRLREAVDETTEKIRITTTSVGPVKAPTEILPDKEGPRNGAIRSFWIHVKTAAPLVVGETHTGALLFQHGGLVDEFPLTITQVAPAAFTVDPEQYDVCVDCGDGDPVFTIRVTNSGSTPITRIKLSSLTMEDASIHVRVVYPLGDSRCESRKDGCWPDRKKEEQTTAGPDVVALSPGEETANESIAPGASRTIHVKLTLPRRAAAYSGALRVSANGGEPKSVHIILRTRGPNGGWWGCPLILFIATLFAGAAAAKILEHYYGSGGGLTRARALLSLDASRGMLGDLTRWLNELRIQVPDALPLTEKAIDRDLREIEESIASEGALKPDELDNRATSISGRVAMRRALRKAALEAGGNADALARIDAVPAEGALAEYEKALAGALAGEPKPGDALSPEPPSPSGKSSLFKAKWIVWLIPRFRYIVWLIVTFGTAYTMFYTSDCSFGTLTDYLTVFLWGLGLTTAGFAVIGEARSSYTPPGAGV